MKTIKDYINESCFEEIEEGLFDFFKKKGAKIKKADAQGKKELSFIEKVVKDIESTLNLKVYLSMPSIGKYWPIEVGHSMIYFEASDENYKNLKKIEKLLNQNYNGCHIYSVTSKKDSKSDASDSTAWNRPHRQNDKTDQAGHIRAYFDDDASYDAGLR